MKATDATKAARERAGIATPSEIEVDHAE